MTLNNRLPPEPAVTTTFVCSEPEDGLAPNSDHRSISLLFFSQAAIWHQAILVSWLTLKLSLPHNILAMISSVSSEGNIGILLWTSWLNIQTLYFGLYLFQSVVILKQLAITILPITGLYVII